MGRSSAPQSWLRAAMLVVIALVALGNALEWVDPDLWIPFVCIIAVMGVGTHGGVLDTLPFVGIELGVVIVLGVATFSGSRDFVWAASVAVSILALGKIAVLRLGTGEAREREGPSAKGARDETGAPGEPRPAPPRDPEE